MGKNILILTGSPRKNSNSGMLAAAFAEGAKGAGHEVTMFDTAANVVKGCRACDMCWSKGHACVFEDGFRDLAPLLAKADALVLAAPLYWYTFPAQIKAAIDKIYAFSMPASKQKLMMKEAVLLMSAEEERKEAFAGSVVTFKEICALLGLEERGTITIGGVHAAGAIAGNPGLAEAKNLGASM
jgi:Multimeric flavodoxin WrbA